MCSHTKKIIRSGFFHPSLVVFRFNPTLQSKFFIRHLNQSCQRRQTFNLFYVPTHFHVATPGFNSMFVRVTQQHWIGRHFRPRVATIQQQLHAFGYNLFSIRPWRIQKKQILKKHKNNWPNSPTKFDLTCPQFRTHCIGGVQLQFFVQPKWKGSYLRLNVIRKKQWVICEYLSHQLSLHVDLLKKKLKRKKSSASVFRNFDFHKRNIVDTLTLFKKVNGCF